MSCGNHGDRGQPIHPFQCRQHRAGIGPHQAVIVNLEIALQQIDMLIKGLVIAVVHAKHIAGEQDPAFVVIGEHGIGPVQVGGRHKLQNMPLP